jgi:DNA repair protein RadC
MVHKTFKVAEVQLTYKPKYKVAERPIITSSKDAYDIFLSSMVIRQNWVPRRE